MIGYTLVKGGYTLVTGLSKKGLIEEGLLHYNGDRLYSCQKEAPSGAQTVWKCQGRTCHFLHHDGVELRGVFRGGGHRLSGGHAEALPSTLRRRTATE